MPAPDALFPGWSELCKRERDNLSHSQRTASIYKNDLTLTTKIASILSNGRSSPGTRRCSSPLTASRSASGLWWWHQRIFKPVFPRLWTNLGNMKPRRIEYFAIKKSHDWICFAVCLFYKHPFRVHGENDIWAASERCDTSNCHQKKQKVESESGHSPI